MFNTSYVFFFSSEDEQINQSMAEALNLSLAINKILKNYDKKLRPNAGGEIKLSRHENFFFFYLYPYDI